MPLRRETGSRMAVGIRIKLPGITQEQFDKGHDHINPERPWPGLAELRRRTEAAGHELRERLAVYPEYTTRAAFLDERLRPRVAELVDAEGFVRPDLEIWRHW